MSEKETVDLNGSQLEFVAEVVHSMNKRYCETHSDNSQPSWNDAPEWQKQSARNGVKYFITNPGVTPEETHVSWMSEKEADGTDQYSQEINSSDTN
jgi:hypothetical protein